MEGQQSTLLDLKDESLVSDEEIESKCKIFTNMLGTQDVVWSSVTGIESTDRSP